MILARHYERFSCGLVGEIPARFVYAWDFATKPDKTVVAFYHGKGKAASLDNSGYRLPVDVAALEKVLNPPMYYGSVPFEAFDYQTKLLDQIKKMGRLVRKAEKKKHKVDVVDAADYDNTKMKKFPVTLVAHCRKCGTIYSGTLLKKCKGKRK